MTLSGARLAGHHPEGRPENDFYPTPAWATEALLEVEQIEGYVWEPAAGDGSMTDPLLDFGKIVKSTDIEPRRLDIDRMDFLNDPYVDPQPVSNIITNPPYKHALEFVLKAKEIADEKIIMLLKTRFLEGQRRQEMWRDTEFPLARLWQFSKRVSMYRNGERGKMGTGTEAFAWFVWDRNHKGPATIGWL